MNNIALGKTLKAMYKLSGKTLTQLSDETGLTLDTINNLFYARIQKPGLAGVNALANAMGFSVQQLIDFLEANPDLPEECDVTELFTKTVSSAADTKESAAPAKVSVRNTKEKRTAETELLNEEHEKQLELFRAAYQEYADQLREQQKRQVEEMQAHNCQMEQHFERSIAALKEAHAQETERLDKENARQRKTGRFLAAAVSIETFLILMFLILDMIFRGIGWLR